MQTETAYDGRIIGELFDPDQNRGAATSKFREAMASSRIRTVTQEKVGRNDPCPCGSGRKFKKCCLGQKWRDAMETCATCGQNVRAGVMTEHLATHEKPKGDYLSIAATMLDCGVEELEPGLLENLRTIDSLTEKCGGALASRQAVAMTIALTGLGDALMKGLSGLEDNPAGLDENPTSPEGG